MYIFTRQALPRNKDNNNNCDESQQWKSAYFCVVKALNVARLCSNVESYWMYRSHRTRAFSASNVRIPSHNVSLLNWIFFFIFILLLFALLFFYGNFSMLFSLFHFLVIENKSSMFHLSRTYVAFSQKP